MIPDDMIVWVLLGAGAFLWFILVFALIIMIELGSIAKSLKKLLMIVYTATYHPDTSGSDKYMEKLRKRLGK